eukprot:5866842-Alexandrium_andersonii.AAC.1
MHIIADSAPIRDLRVHPSIPVVGRAVQDVPRDDGAVISGELLLGLPPGAGLEVASCLEGAVADTAPA